jgi:hypothetical protein
VTLLTTSVVEAGRCSVAGLEGVLLAESLRPDVALEDGNLDVWKISRADAGDEAAGQPRTWTFLHFRAPTAHADQLAAAFSAALEPSGGWYCDFRSADDTFVVFGGRIFHYPRGDRAKRIEVEEYARSVGVPDAQLDWPE